MKGGKLLLGWLLLLGLTGWTGYTLFREVSLSVLFAALCRLHPLCLLAGVGLMALFLTCEGLSSRLILTALGHRPSCLQLAQYACTGFYFSSVTPSASGGQPAQVLAMKKNGIPLSHGTLNMLLITICYQTATLLFAFAARRILPSTASLLGHTLDVLLLLGGGVTLVLTGGMLFFLLRPPASSRFDGYRSAATLLRQQPLLFPKVFALTCGQLLCLYLIPFLVCRGFGIPADPLEMLAVQSLLSLATGCLPLPGAAGAAETAFLRGFTHFFGTNLVAPALLVSRGLSFYLPLLLTGCITLLFRFSPFPFPLFSKQKVLT